MNMKEIMNQEQLERTLKRMTHEIIERNPDLEDVVLAGILKKGHPIATILKENLKRFAQIDVPVHALDIWPYRDDLDAPEQPATPAVSIKDKVVILVDDVLYTGRSVRAAMDALTHLGRPRQIQLAILIDRGHRELPIRADYIGKNIPTSRQEHVIVDIDKMCVWIAENK
ncbi:MAG: bifunctional pyr operon transcriptional regulator/uracil phosphoribosyltransferase PyrR [Acholeplasmataceae bacterium]|nr:MAG: bifunctional pyr operon transcriptional regulator/uracil phosphoribosyltransferase PyrR [Acholeplasmataceae bacterium]